MDKVASLSLCVILFVAVVAPFDGISADPISLLDPDSDGDGITDDVELMHGTNPHDRGSALGVSTLPICSSWNSFWYGHLNIFEHANRSAVPLDLRSTLFSPAGHALGSQEVHLNGLAQFDLLQDVFNIPNDSYGLACASEGATEAYEGRAIQYKLVRGTTLQAPEFEFAFTLEGTSGHRGAQAVTYNTYHPSQETGGFSLYRTNWVVLSNLDSVGQTGLIRIYDHLGNEVASVPLTIEGKGERHFAAHTFGLDQVGQVRWEPADPTKRAALRSIRYYYDNFVGEPGFQSAAAIDGAVGSGEELMVPVDGTTGWEVIEIANTLPIPVNIEFTGWWEYGVELATASIKLEAYETRNFLLAGIFPPSLRGTLRLRGDRPESLIAYVMHYGRGNAGSVSHAYGTRLIEAAGNDLRSSFNTFLDQDCEIHLANATGAPVDATVAQRTLEGELIGQYPLHIVAHGSVHFDLCRRSAADRYGTVVVSTPIAGAVVGTVVRIGHNEQYRFTTPLLPSSST